MECSIFLETGLWNRALLEAAGIDPLWAGSYNLMCSGRPLVLLPIFRHGSRWIKKEDRRAPFDLEAHIEWLQGTARKARDGAP